MYGPAIPMYGFGAVMFGWGLLSVAQIKMLHPLLESAILGIPAAVSAFMGTILVAVCAADTALSVRSSMPAHSSRVK
ncbi:MAG: hypothetical protein HFI64_05080 [Lachnospiraceae bacterium]|nr:hypothetical protein [Lachnospiraceae bacterium]